MKTKRNIELAGIMIRTCEAEINKYQSLQRLYLSEKDLEIKLRVLNYCESIIKINQTEIDCFNQLIEKWQK